MSGAGTIIFAVIILGIVLGSLIPAIVIKLLMRAVFRRRVSFWMVLLASVIAALLSTVGYVALVYVSTGGLAALAADTALTPAQGLGLTAASFLLQLLIMAFVVPDENLELIPISRWLVVLVLQYVVYIVIAIVVALLVMQFGGPAQAMLSLTR